VRERIDDGYLDGSYRWWHLSLPSPELTDAIASGWFPNVGRVLDVGCGAGSELSVLGGLGVAATGIDLSLAGLRMAREQGAMSVAPV
jgi:2-polyprenyl-3-methyl-5-hydroxy-6-metoxy-1,4-benzoquinol methylase